MVMRVREVGVTAEREKKKLSGMGTQLGNGRRRRRGGMRIGVGWVDSKRLP